MSRSLKPAGALVRASHLPLLAACALTFAGHGAAAQSSPSEPGAGCPAILSTPDAHRVAAEAVAAMRVQENNLSVQAVPQVFPQFQHDFTDGALMGLPGSQYQDHKAAFDHVSRARIASCYPDVDAILAEIEQAPIRKAQARAQAEAERQATQQQAAQERQQAQADEARREAAATEQAQQQADEEQRALEAQVQALGAKHRQQILRDQAERARREQERLQQEEEQATARAAAQAQEAEQQKIAAAKAQAMQAERERKQQAADAEHDRIEQAWVAEASKPRNLLVGAYRNYIAVRQCAASREGFAMVYVVPERLEQAKAEIRAIEAALLRQDPSIDKDAAWQEANGPDRLPDPDATPTDQMLKAMGAASSRRTATTTRARATARTPPVSSISSPRLRTRPAAASKRISERRAGRVEFESAPLDPADPDRGR